MPKQETIIYNHCDECPYVETGGLAVIGKKEPFWGWEWAVCSQTKRNIGKNITPPIDIPDWCPLEDI